MGIIPGDAPLLGAFPLYPPLELFHSFGLKPVVLWGMDRARDETPAADRHLQAFTCSVARRLADFVLGGRGATIAGLFSYNACDTLRNLPEIIADGLAESGRRVPHFKCHLPARPIADGYVGRYLYEEMDRLISELEAAYGRVFSPPRFVASVKKYRAMRDLVLRLQELAASGSLPFADVAAAVETGAMKSVEEQTADYQALIDRAEPGGKTMIPVVLSGILAPPAPVLRAIEEAGMTVVANDLAALHRAHAHTPENFAGPADYYADFYCNHFPCPTLIHTADRRVGAVIDLVKKSDARGLVFVGEKFCEYEYFEYPALERRLKEMDVPCLPLEFGLGDRSVNPTRLQAFVELINKGGE